MIIRKTKYNYEYIFKSDSGAIAHIMSHFDARTTKGFFGEPKRWRFLSKKRRGE